VEKAIVFLQQQQTEDEQATHSTVHHNSRGWSYDEAAFGASLAEWINKGRHFSPAQLRCARKMAIRHASQLSRLGCFGTLLDKIGIREDLLRPIRPSDLRYVDALTYSHNDQVAMIWAIQDCDPFAIASVSPPCSAR
jgi:hypothetical protein